MSSFFRGWGGRGRDGGGGGWRVVLSLTLLFSMHIVTGTALRCAMCKQVLYVPSAQTLIEGGHFHKGEDGLWETPEVAKALLRSMVTNHAKDLEKLTCSSGESLLKVCLLFSCCSPAVLCTICSVHSVYLACLLYAFQSVYSTGTLTFQELKDLLTFVRRHCES